MSEKSTSTAEQKLQELELTNIIPSPDNPRIVNEKSEQFGELVESIRAMGVIVPVHVRDHPKRKDNYELLAGERRLLAAARADRKTIRAICHGVISDGAAFEITFAENFSREDLTPLEQGKAVETLMIKYKGDTQAVASKMGKSVRWVMQRVVLSKNLSKNWKVAIIENPYFRLWTAAHLQLIAVFPANIQTELLKAYDADIWDFNGTISVKQLENELAKRLKLLNKAPWSLGDTKLVTGIKACNKCTKRSSHQPGLFDDTTDLETIKKNDRCLDAECWKQKTTAWLKDRISVIKASDHPGLVCVATNSPTYYEGEKLGEIYGGLVSNWKASKERAKGAVPAMVVAGNDTGQVRWIRPYQEPTSSSSSGKVKGKPTPLKERRVMLDKKRWFVVIRELIEKVEESNVDDIVSGDKILTVMALAETFGIDGEPFGRDNSRTWKSFSQKTDGQEVLVELWGSVKNTISGNLSYCGPITQTSDKLIEDAKSAAKLLGININAMFKEVAKNKYREPKSWAGLNADGTPKTKTKKTAKKKKSTKKKGAKKAAKKSKKKTKVRTCRVCGCTEDKACITDGVPCHWIEKDLCSACEGK